MAEIFVGAFVAVSFIALTALAVQQLFSFGRRVR